MPVQPQVTVSSAGMLVQKLDVEDLQHERGTFDGTMVYAQNKVHLGSCLQKMHMMTLNALQGYVVNQALCPPNRGSRWF